MNLTHGIFTISLDFELYWGLRDKWSIERCKDNLRGVRNAVHKILHAFEESHIHATWAAVGFLFFYDRNDLMSNIPKLLPKYQKEELSPYKYIKEAHELEAEYHFAPDLIELIRQHSGQEIGTHTFSHYYCREEGQSQPQFEEDLFRAIKIAKTKGVSIKSLVFPRNQWRAEYLPTLVKLGIRCFRGNEANWMYVASDGKGQNQFKRAFRLIDAYLNLSGHHTYDLANCIQKNPFNFPSSRFLRSYSSILAIFDRLRLRRITRAMDEAAIHKRIFHLWWHPENFGINTDENIGFLKKIMLHYDFLKKNHGMVSLNMGELCSLKNFSRRV